MDHKPSKLLDIIAGVVVLWYSLPPDQRAELNARFWRAASEAAGHAAYALNAAGEQLGRLSIRAQQQYRRAVAR